MDIEAAEARQIQNTLGQNLAEGGDGDEVWLEGAELLQEGGLARPFGLKDGKVRTRGQLLNG